MLEIAWTVIPVLILVVMAIPSFRLVYYEDRTRDADLTVKVTGHQWYWEYSYPDNNNINFTSYIIPDDQLKPGQRRLLEVDNELVVPVGKNIRVLQTSTDVIHSWFIPALGVQRYAIPGRTIETWFKVDQPGTFYGECNQICGTNHSRMPIVVRAVPEQEFDAWLERGEDQILGRGATAPTAAPGRRGRGSALTRRAAPEGDGRCRQPPTTMPTIITTTSPASCFAGCAAPTTRTSARFTSASPWSAAWWAASCPRSCARSSTSPATRSSPTGRRGTRSSPRTGC